MSQVNNATREASEISQPVRISHIAGHYLIFDIKSVIRLRRGASSSGMFVGTLPQQPTQNIFLGLPLELRPDEVSALLSRGIADVVDDTENHSHAFLRNNDTCLESYVSAVQRGKRTAQSFLDNPEDRRYPVSGKPPHLEATNLTNNEQHRSTSDEVTIAPNVPGTRTHPTLALTLASSKNLFLNARLNHVDRLLSTSACMMFQHRGYFVTPGLRFGARYSVYPGDPLRFHAHYMANHYNWHEEISILDIVGGGRLATAVKKSFLICSSEHDQLSGEHPPMRCFSIEWASM